MYRGEVADAVDAAILAAAARPAYRGGAGEEHNKRFITTFRSYLII